MFAANSLWRQFRKDRRSSSSKEWFLDTLMSQKLFDLLRFKLFSPYARWSFLCSIDRSFMWSYKVKITVNLQPRVGVTLAPSRQKVVQSPKYVMTYCKWFVPISCAVKINCPLHGHSFCSTKASAQLHAILPNVVFVLVQFIRSLIIHKEVAR